ncbi:MULTISPECIES: helix-turn-helix domain-containing protein [Thermomonospora]|uniref:Helix-turn-helix domain protein n=1 Tax=Thermomonospora curvata (strain ATCC 19995 / DSM 43183 / JCM 3096 / KCTC 9072 / NBRC 15933 / NCIMB 10081 / Henssen B9) TaxID=471852 RepID=D1ACY6_THECD|nr:MULTISPECIES: helix-turn-helix transcriptional regulator [Thermomonospora]ACY99295.1 helix-turn-helix domain protein [Thermomonospora curvata DSM 43183]PKK12353.1 MAG: XRE family transcriptional regulator [Thermomonospora sp. CIF 1]
MRTPQRATLRSQWLGQQLRELREKSGLLLKDAAEYLQRDPGTVSRFESGFYPIRRPDLLALMDLYGVSDPQRREALLRLSQDVWQKGWWDGYVHDVAGSMIDFVWLEARATHIRSFAAIVVPGLLQTPEYAEHVIRVNEPGASPDQIKRWLELRMTRQRLLDGDTPPRLSVILDEAVLHRQIGTPAIMAAQLRHLIEYAARPTVDIRVLPFRAGTPAGTYGTFDIFTLPDSFPEVAYTETLAGAIYIESPDTERFIRAYDGHESLALGPADSIELISALAEEWQ